MLSRLIAVVQKVFIVSTHFTSLKLRLLDIPINPSKKAANARRLQHMSSSIYVFLELHLVAANRAPLTNVTCVSLVISE